MSKSTCSVDGCEADALARGWCNKHYIRWTKNGTTDLIPRAYPAAGHGTVQRYRKGCRCDKCSSASRDRKRRYRAEHAPAVKAAQAAYEAANKDRASARKKADRLANPEKYRKRLAEYHATEAGKLNRHLRKLRRRAREADAEMCSVTASDWRNLVRQYRGCCAYCGASDRPLTREHVIPLARGGRHAIGNILPVCGSCNYSKADRLLIEWRAWKRALAA